MYLHPELETMSRPEIEKLQLERLKQTVGHCMNSPFYKKRFEENNLTPDSIQSLADLQKIPFTTKQDLRDTYPFGIASVPLDKCVRLHSSSGTTGKPTSFCIDKVQQGLGCVNSWQALPMEQYRVHYQDYDITFVMTPMKEAY